MVTTQLPLALAILLGIIGAGLVVYQIRMLNRGRAIHMWVESFLRARYGVIPSTLRIVSTDDSLWPVLASFDEPRDGRRLGMRFDCGGQPGNWHLESERPIAR